MAKAKLDATYCMQAMCSVGSKKQDHWDTQIPGLVLEVRPSGTATFALRYTDEDGRQRQQKIGGYGEISVDQARKAAAKLRAEVLLGGNPRAEKERKRAVPTYAHLADAHLEYARTHIRSHESTERMLRCHIVPKWGRLRIDQIYPQDISRWLAEKRQSGLADATVERIRVTMSRSFVLAKKWQYPGAEANPLEQVERKGFNNARSNFLTPDETRCLMDACKQSENPQLASIVALLLLTGARKMELLKAKWCDVDLERRSWLLPQTKNGTVRHVPLSQQAIEIIRSLPRFDDCEWLIPNPATRLPYVSIKRAWDTARKAALLQDFHIHDLRHSFCSSAVQSGVDLYTVGAIVGHKDYKSTQRYAHLAQETLLKAVEQNAANLNIDWTSQAG